MYNIRYNQIIVYNCSCSLLHLSLHGKTKILIIEKNFYPCKTSWISYDYTTLDTNYDK